MIDGHEHRDLSLTGDGRGQVGAPHRVRRLGDDGAVVVARASGRADPRGGEEIVLAHEPQHATLGRAKACHAQPGPDLPVTLTVKGAGGQNRADRVHQRRIRHRPNRAWTPGRVGPRGGEMPIDAGPCGAPDPAHAGQAIGPAACGRDGPAHRRDLRRAKGRLASSAAILASSNSRSSSISPSFAFRRSVSSASPLVDRVTRLASPAETKVSCHPLRVAAVTPSARERISRPPPRNGRRPPSRLRWRDMRPPRPKPTPPEAVVCVFIVTLLRITSALKSVSANRGAQQADGASTAELTLARACPWLKYRLANGRESNMRAPNVGGRQGQTLVSASIATNLNENNFPLVVDLDGTLIRTDLLFESFFQLLAEQPVKALAAITALKDGKAALKA